MPVRKICLLICLGLGLLLAACAGSGPALSNLDNSVSSRAARPGKTPPAASAAPYLYNNAEGNFSLSLPGGWTASQPRPTPFGHLYLFSSARPDAEDISVLISKPEIGSAETALAYLCPDCRADALVVQPVTLGGRPAQHVSLTGEPAPDLVWYLVEQNGRVLVFTLHASDNAALYADILQTLHFYQ